MRPPISSPDFPAGQRIKVLLVTQRLDLGGTERHVLDLATGLDRDAFDVEVLSFMTGGEIAKRLAETGVRVHVVRRHSSRDPTFPFKLAAVMRRGGYDVVHTFLFPTTMWGGLGARMAGVRRIIASARNIYFADSRKRKVGVRIVAPLVERFLCNSEAAKRLLVAVARVPGESVEVIYNAVDTDRFVPVTRDDAWRELRREAGLPEEEGMVVGCVANLKPEKNHALLLEAMRKVVERRPGTRLILVGDGPLRPELESMAGRLGISGNVRFLGSLEDTTKALRLFDLFVLSSRSESLPNAVCEAMATGLPCVVTGVGGVPEIVADGETGCVVPPGDAKAFAGAMLSLMADREKMLRMGKTGRLRAVEMFSMERMLRRMTEIFSGGPRAEIGGHNT